MEMEHLSMCPICRSKTIHPINGVEFLCRCEECCYVFDNPRPTKNEITKYYSKPSKYDVWLENLTDREALWKRRLSLLKKYGKKNGYLLDVSTGIGQFLHTASSYFSVVVGTEVSDSAIELAQERYGLKIHKGTLDEIEFKGTHFDVVTLFHVLEHVQNPHSVIKSCYNLLNPGGLIVVAVPNDVHNIKSIVKYYLTKWRIKPYKNFNKYMLPKIKLDGSVDEIHLSHFTLNTLEYLFKDVGLEVVDSGLDPHYVAHGAVLTRKNIYFKFMSFINTVFKKNMYETIWLVGKKVN